VPPALFFEAAAPGDPFAPYYAGGDPFAPYYAGGDPFAPFCPGGAAPLARR